MMQMNIILLNLLYLIATLLALPQFAELTLKVWYGVEQNVKSLRNWFRKEFNKFCRMVRNQRSVAPFV